MERMMWLWGSEDTDSDEPSALEAFLSENRKCTSTVVTSAGSGKGFRHSIRRVARSLSSRYAFSFGTFRALKDPAPLKPKKPDPPIVRKMRLRHINRQPFNPQNAACRVFQCTAEDHEKLKTFKPS
jgi:hypothetical protein